ncbi:MAG: IPT/TIG domain-containing protein [Acidimicrobiales bacterium]
MADVAAIEATTDGGSTWRSQSLPTVISELGAVSCPTLTDCWGSGLASTGGVVILSTAPTIESVSPTSGKPRTAVTLSGINLSGATAVSFDGTAAKIATDSATELATAVPAGAKFGEITVTTPLGRASSPAVFSVM